MGIKPVLILISLVDIVTIYSPNLEVDLMLPTIKVLKGKSRKNILFIFYYLKEIYYLFLIVKIVILDA